VILLLNIKCRESKEQLTKLATVVGGTRQRCNIMATTTQPIGCIGYCWWWWYTLHWWQCHTTFRWHTLVMTNAEDWRQSNNAVSEMWTQSAWSTRPTSMHYTTVNMLICDTGRNLTSALIRQKFGGVTKPRSGTEDAQDSDRNSKTDSWYIFRVRHEWTLTTTSSMNWYQK